MKLKVKKGATVEVISGSDKGKKGEVIQVDPKKMRVKVQGIKVATHFDKKDGIKKLESFIDYSNVKMIKAPEGAKQKKSAAKASAKRA